MLEIVRSRLSCICYIMSMYYGLNIILWFHLLCGDDNPVLDAGKMECGGYDLIVEVWG